MSKINQITIKIDADTQEKLEYLYSKDKCPKESLKSDMERYFRVWVDNFYGLVKGVEDEKEVRTHTMSDNTKTGDQFIE